jgi:hypothetical protein
MKKMGLSCIPRNSATDILPEVFGRVGRNDHPKISTIATARFAIVVQIEA